MLPVSIAEQDVPQSAHASEYLLVCTASSFAIDRGSWNFSLESVDGQSVLEAGDEDLGDLNRLTLLAAVRGLEAIDGASVVTLLSHNRYLIRSLSDSLPRWRENNFVWEHFGRRIDVQHADLWRRVDTALSIHCVEACLVSSRRVSPMMAQQSTIVQPPSNDGTSWRIDAGHQDHVSGKAAIPAPKRASTARPKDSLRRWLLDSATSHATRGGGRRFTAADLAESA
ncbi:ribonuclease HI [Rubripirellula obstinata]